MDFKTNKPIYQQIVDFCFSKILTREWRAEERVVSVRELSTQLAVNSRTVLKAYEYLQTEDIIYPERGMGFYLSKDAVKKVMRIQEGKNKLTGKANAEGMVIPVTFTKIVKAVQAR